MGVFKTRIGKVRLKDWHGYLLNTQGEYMYENGKRIFGIFRRVLTHPDVFLRVR